MIFHKSILRTVFGAQVYIWIALLYSSCMSNDDPNKMEITLFEPKCRIDTLITNNKMFRYKVISYLVDGYRNTAAHEAKLDSFVCASWDSSWVDYAECVIPIHKKSRHINNENIKKNPHDYYDYPDERKYLYMYYWSRDIGYIKTVEKEKRFFDGVLCKEKR